MEIIKRVANNREDSGMWKILKIFFSHRFLSQRDQFSLDARCLSVSSAAEIYRTTLRGICIARRESYDAACLGLGVTTGIR